MRYLLPILLLSWLAVGCGLSATSVAESTDQAPQAKDVRLPAESPATRLGLIRDGQTLQAGDPIEKALRIFPRPERANSVNELPEGWPRGFRASGWESDKEGFGMILQDDRVVGALLTEDDVDQARVKQILDDYQQSFGAPPVPGPAQGYTRYSFWDDQIYRCGVCVTRNAKSQTRIVVAMGYSSVMDALGMSPDGAKEDIDAALRIMQQTASK